MDNYGYETDSEGDEKELSGNNQESYSEDEPECQPNTDKILIDPYR
jgi:hypothetical protein